MQNKAKNRLSQATYTCCQTKVCAHTPIRKDNNMCMLLCTLERVERECASYRYLKRFKTSKNLESFVLNQCKGLFYKQIGLKRLKQRQKTILRRPYSEEFKELVLIGVVSFAMEINPQIVRDGYHRENGETTTQTPLGLLPYIHTINRKDKKKAQSFKRQNIRHMDSIGFPIASSHA